MLEFYYTDKRKLELFNRGPLGPYFDGFAAYLKKLGYLRTALNFFHPARRTSSSYRGELLPPSAANFFHFVIPPATV